MRRTTLNRTALLACTALIAACTSAVEPRQRLVDAPSQAASIDRPLGESGNSVMEAPAVTELRLSGTALRIRAMDTGERLPNREVGPLTLSGVDPVTAISLMGREHGVSVAADEGASRRMTRMDLAGRMPLQRAVDAVATNAGVFWSYRGGVIQIRDKQRFVVEIPPVEGMMDEVAESLRNLGAENVSSGRQTSTVTFIADRGTAEAAQVYLDRVARSANLIVFDTWILEVTLNDDNAIGINWNRLRANIGSGSVSAGGPTGLAGSLAGSMFTLGLAPNIGSVTMDLVLGFLNREGSVRSIARPTITTVAGTEGFFRVGQDLKYIERTQTSFNNSFMSMGPQPATLRTGIELTVRGSESEGTIISTIDLKMTTLLRFTEYSTGGTTQTTNGQNTQDAQNGQQDQTSTNPVAAAANAAGNLLGLNSRTANRGPQTLRLPETANREIRDVARARPGDLIVLAGMLQSSDDLERQRLLGIPSNATRREQRQEIVTILRPRLVRFIREGG